MQEVLERDIRQRHLRRHTFAVILGGDTGEEVPGACGAGLGHHVLEAVEAVGLSTHRVGKACHTVSP